MNNKEKITTAIKELYESIHKHLKRVINYREGRLSCALKWRVELRTCNNFY
jgi:hypothetical protein